MFEVGKQPLGSMGRVAVRFQLLDDLDLASDLLCPSWTYRSTFSCSTLLITNGYQGSRTSLVRTTRDDASRDPLACRRVRLDHLFAACFRKHPAEHSNVLRRKDTAFTRHL